MGLIDGLSGVIYSNLIRESRYTLFFDGLVTTLEITVFALVTADAIVITKITAPPIDIAVLVCFETPKNGHNPKNCDKTTLLTKETLISVKISVFIFQDPPLTKIYLFDIDYRDNAYNLPHTLKMNEKHSLH